MAKSINKITLLGNVGNLEIKKTAAGVPFAKFSIATASGYKDKDGKWAENTQWHNCVAWNKLAEVVEKFVTKGDKMYCEGEVQYNQVTQADGSKRTFTSIRADNIVLLGSGQSKNNPGAHRAANDVIAEIEGGASGDDGLPF